MRTTSKQLVIAAFCDDAVGHGVDLKDTDYDLLQSLSEPCVERIGMWLADAWANGFRQGEAQPCRRCYPKEADTRSIAAAPDLRAACEKVIAFADACKADGNSWDGCAFVRECREAIAKAETGD